MYMFGPNIPGLTTAAGRGLSFGKILGGISKTLGVVNQIIPIYKEAKPMINNAKTALSIVKEFGNSTTNRIMTNKEKNLQPLKQKIKQSQIINSTITYPNEKGPTFFQ